jgi:hypothetical protein
MTVCLREIARALISSLITIGVVILAIVLNGCALLQSPTPRSNAKVTNYSLTTDTRRDGRVIERNSPASSIELPEVWTAGNVRLTSIEEWQEVGPDWAGTVEPPMLRREVQIERITDPSVAGELGAIRAQGTAQVTTDVGTALLSATAMSLLRYMESQDFRQQQITDRRIAELQAEIEALRLAPPPVEHHEEPPPPEEPAPPPEGE